MMYLFILKSFIQLTLDVCSPRQPMAAYMWNGLQPVTPFTLIPNPNPNPKRMLPGHCAAPEQQGSLAPLLGRRLGE